MTKRDLIEELVERYPRFSRRDAEVMVNAVFESLADALRRGARVEIRGFCSFVVKHRQAREGRILGVLGFAVHGPHRGLAIRGRADVDP